MKTTVGNQVPTLIRRLLLVVLVSISCVMSQGCVATRCLQKYANSEGRHEKHWTHSCDRAYRTSDGRILLYFHSATPGLRQPEEHHAYIPIQQIERALQLSTPGQPIEGSQFPTNWPDASTLLWCYYIPGGFAGPDYRIMLPQNLSHYSKDGHHSDGCRFVWHFPIVVPLEVQQPGWPPVENSATNQDIPLTLRVMKQPLLSSERWDEHNRQIVREAVLSVEARGEIDQLRIQTGAAGCILVSTNATQPGYFVYIKNEHIKNDENYLLFCIPPRRDLRFTERKWAQVFLPVTVAVDIVTFPIQAVVVPILVLYELDRSGIGHGPIL